MSLKKSGEIQSWMKDTVRVHIRATTTDPAALSVFFKEHAEETSEEEGEAGDQSPSQEEFRRDPGVFIIYALLGL
jgi:hypothetical protein